MALFDGARPGRAHVKICGITRANDAIAAAQSGADAIGMVFYAPSPRAVDIPAARSILQAVPTGVSCVGLFVNAARDEVEEILRDISLDILQFHGDETPDFCSQFRKPYIKAVRMQPQTDLDQVAADYGDAAALLLDAYVEGTHGGTGRTFDWSHIPTSLDKPVILAGGLTVDNVRDAVEQVKPYAVDVSGGVESEKGIKDHQKIAAFIREVGNAEY